MSTHIRLMIDQEEALIYTPFGTSVTRAKNFANAIAKYTNASITHVWATSKANVPISAKSGDTQSLDLCAHLFFRRALDNKLYGLKIHAPNYDEIFNENQEVPTEVGTAIASLFSTLAGETFTFHFGALAGDMA